MDYALLDWDNTLRKGYTLFTWMDYLIDIGVLESVVREEVDYYIEEYKRKKYHMINWLKMHAMFLQNL